MPGYTSSRSYSRDDDGNILGYYDTSPRYGGGTNFTGYIDGERYNDRTLYNDALKNGSSGQRQSKNLETLINEYQTAMDNANAANQARYDQGMGMYDDLISSSQQGFDQRLDSLTQMTDADLDAIIGGYQDRYETGMDMLQGRSMDSLAGRDRRRVSALASDANPVNLRANPALAGAVANSMQQGTNRDFNEEDAAAEDAMRRRRFANHRDMSGEQRSAEDRYRQQRTVMLDAATEQQNRAMQDLPKQKIGFMGRKEELAPTLDQIADIAIASGTAMGDYQIPLFKTL